MDATKPDGDFTVHAETYHRFMLGVKWFSLHLAALLVLLVLWFATPAGFGGGLVAAIVIMAAGIYALRHGLNHSTERDSLSLGAP